MRSLVGLLAILPLLASCRGMGADGGAAIAAPAAPTDAIPAEAFFRDPELSHLRLSPDGRHVAGVASRDGVRWIVVRGTRGGEVRFLAKLDEPGERIRTLGWAGDGRILAGVEMPSEAAKGVRARQSRLFVVSLDGSPARWLGRHWPVHADSQWPELGRQWTWHENSRWHDQVIDWMWDDPDHVLINWWRPDRNGASVRRLDLRTGALRSVVRFLPFVTLWAADHRGRVRAGWGSPPTRSGYFLVARARPDQAFEKLIEFDPFEEPGFFFAGFSSDPSTIYVTSADASGRVALYTYDLASRRLGPLVFGHPEVDLGRLHFSPRDGRLRAVEYATDRPRIYFLDEDAQREQAALDRTFPGTTNRIISRDRREVSAIVSVSGDTVPPRYYHYRRGSRRIELLALAYPELDSRTLAPMRPVSFRARDGLEIPGYLTLPLGALPERLPAVLVVHDGPAARDVWGWNATVQFLASRGFAVLQPNFRGSTGYGVRHAELGHRQWGLAMQDDLEDAARWLVDQGIADPDRIGIYGAGYGGYAALWALVRSPGLFSAGASLGGATDLVALRDDHAWSRADVLGHETLGGRWSDRARLRDTSPATHADKIHAPVLLAHGAADEVVHVKHALRMADALGDRGESVATSVYEDEPHAFVHEDNRIDFHERLGAFFARHLSPTGSLAAGSPPD